MDRRADAYPGRSHTEVEKAVISPVLVRWRCPLDAADATAATTDVGWVALATLLHKHGIQDSDISARASTSVDEVNRHVVLSDVFESSPRRSRHRWARRRHR